jgi:hypothetical protein
MFQYGMRISALVPGCPRNKFSEVLGFVWRDGILGVVSTYCGSNTARDVHLLANFRTISVYSVLRTLDGRVIYLVTPRTTYRLVYSAYLSTSGGDFNLTLGQPRPNSRLDVWNYLSNSAEVVAVSPNTCLPSSDEQCGAYLFLGLEQFVWTFPNQQFP